MTRLLSLPRQQKLFANNQRHHKELDFEWLATQTKEKQTLEYLKTMQTARKSFIEKGNYPLVGRKVRLKLNDCIISACTNKPYSTVMAYTEIFRDHEHMRFSGFRHVKGVVIDVGANEGFYAIKMGLLNPEARIYCIEPGKKAFKLLQANVKLNSLAGRVLLINSACWSSKGQQNLMYLPSNTTNASLERSPVKSPWLATSQARKAKIQTTTIADIVEARKITQIDLLKIDTEGSELEILKGAEAILDRVNRIVVEYHSKDLRSGSIKLLRSKGFNCIGETKDKVINVISGNLYFVKA